MEAPMGEDLFLRAILGEDLFLRAILSNPKDDASLLIYADCLEEEGDPVSAAKAEFLRVTVELSDGPGREGWKEVRRKRLQELAASLDTDWLAVVSRQPIEKWRFIRDFFERMFHVGGPSPRQLTACHEAGHAVAAVAFGIGIKYVSVVDDRDTLGRIVLDQGCPHLRPGFDPRVPEDRRVAEGWVLLALAGEFADADHGGREPDFRSPEAGGDFLVAAALAERLCAGPGERDAFLEEMKRRVSRFVREPLRWRQIAAVATRLGRLGELNRDQVGQIMDEIAGEDESLGPD
jgi:uncharacterized protein (TIGR02996 family)